jgi:hypothetical protein
MSPASSVLIRDAGPDQFCHFSALFKGIAFHTRLAWRAGPISFQSTDALQSDAFS